MINETPELHLDGKVAEARFTRPVIRFVRKCLYFGDIECPLPHATYGVCKKCPYAFFLSLSPARKMVDIITGTIAFLGLMLLQGQALIQQIILQLSKILP